MKPSKQSMRLDIPSIAAGIIYGGTMFMAGFAMGAIRVILLEPRVGEVLAFMVEVPIMLPTCWYLSWQAMMCWYLLNMVLAWGDKKRYSNVDIMGVTSFLTLVALDVALSMILFHRSFSETREVFSSRLGSAGLAVQLLASSFPIIQEAIQERRMQ